jgi:hypothetical protein
MEAVLAPIAATQSRTHHKPDPGAYLEERQVQAFVVLMIEGIASDYKKGRIIGWAVYMAEYPIIP